MGWSSGLHASLALRGPSFKPSCLHSLLANQKKGFNGKRQTVVVTPCCNPKEDVHLQKRHMPVCQEEAHIADGIKDGTQDGISLWSEWNYFSQTSYHVKVKCEHFATA